MMFCSKCGKGNNNDSRFCLNCGAPLDPPVQNIPQEMATPGFAVSKPEPGGFVRFLKKRWMILAPAVAVILVILFSLGSIIAAVSPSYAVARATKNTFSMLGRRADNTPLEALGALVDCTRNGTIGATFSYDDGYGTETSGAMTLLSNYNQKNYELIGNLSINGNDIDVTALFNPNRLALNSPLIDDKYYGITYKTFEQDIKKFAEVANLDDETVKTLIDAVDNMRSSMNNEQAEMLAKYSKLISDFIRDLKPETSREQISLNGDDISCKAVKYVVTEDDLDKLLHDFYAMFKDDKEMRDYFVSYFNNMGAGSLYGAFGYYGDGTGGDGSDAFYDNMLDSMRSAIDSFKDEYSGKITFSYFISGSKLIRFELSGSPKISGEKASFDFSIDFGKRPDKNDIDINVSLSDDSGFDTNVKATLRSELKSGVQTDQLKIKASGETILLKSEWTKKTGELVLSFEGGGLEYEVDGNLTNSNGGFKLVLDDLIDEAYGIGSLDLTITAQKGAKIPNPSYINLDKWDQDLLDKLESAASELSGLGGGYYDDSSLFGNTYSS